MRPRPAPPRGARRPRRNRKKPDIAGHIRNLLALALIAQLLHVAFWSPKLAVQRVEVVGAQRLAANEVRRLAGVRPGQNTFRISLARVRQQLLKEPQIRSVSVTRRLPGAVVIHVRERQPHLALVRRGKAWEADETGFVYRAVPAPPRGVPVLEIRRGFDPAPGRRMPSPWLKAAAECVRLATQHHLRLARMAIDAQGELWLHISTPAENASLERLLPVRLGRLADLPAKFADIRLWLPHVASDGEYLNVMCPGRAAYLRLGSAGSANPPSP